MADFTIYTPENAPELSQPVLKNMKENFGFDVNFFGLLAESPVALHAYPAISEIFGDTSFSPLEQHVILLATSVENECEFCVAVHSTVLRKAVEADDAIIDALRAGTDGPDEKLNALARTVRALVRNKGRLNDAEIDAFIDAGYTKAQLFEAIVGISVKTLTNYSNNLGDTPVNEEFAAESWSPDQKKAA